VRTFKRGEDLISTLERDPRNDPTAIDVVDGDPHHGNLWPVEVDFSERYDPVPEPDGGNRGRIRYGYPLCFSRTNFEWYPYLPAVSSFHYPIFRGMTSARIVSNGFGWKLRDEDILLWSSVEFVMLRTIQVMGAGQLTSLEHVTPDWPETFGYKRLHKTEKFAATAKKASLNAFQRMLAYCSYTVAEASIAKLINLPNEYRTVFQNPHWVEEIFKKIGEGAQNTDVHVLLKILWATIGEIRGAYNFVGIVVNYHKEFHYPSVLAMHRYGVPVFVRWHKTLKLESYKTYHQNHMLKEWAPKLDDFRVLEESDVHHPPPSGESVGAPRPLNPKSTFLDPMDYVRKRKAEIEVELRESDKAQSMRDRQKSAMRFGSRSHRGANLFELERNETKDERTGEIIVWWERKPLTKKEAAETYETASPRQLW